MFRPYPQKNVEAVPVAPVDAIIEIIRKYTDRNLSREQLALPDAPSIRVKATLAYQIRLAVKRQALDIIWTDTELASQAQKLADRASRVAKTVKGELIDYPVLREQGEVTEMAIKVDRLIAKRDRAIQTLGRTLSLFAFAPDLDDNQPDTLGLMFEAAQKESHDKTEQRTETAREVAQYMIELGGFDLEDSDMVGAPMGDTVQTLLMTACLLQPDMADAVHTALLIND